jgi:hypothetical protein
MNGKRLVFLGFTIAIVLIIVRDTKKGVVPPTPAEFLGAAIVYGFAGVIAELAPPLGGALAIGWTAGLAFNLIPEGTPLVQLTGQQKAAQQVRAQQGGNI